MRIWRYIDEVARVGSVRQAAERLNVTPSALLRRIQDVEHDLEAAIFERHVSGVQLTAAGEVLIRWIRSQNADLRRVYSEIGELSGLKRGEVRISCSQAVSRSFVLKEILKFRESHPNVVFRVHVTNHIAALQALVAYESDLVLIFRPSRSAELQTIMSVGQGLVAVMAANHPLAAQTTVRLHECAEYDVALPDPSFGGRDILTDQLATKSAKFNVVFEADSFEMLADFVAVTSAITFQIDIGALGWRHDPRFAVRPVNNVDGTHGPLVLGQLKGRSLPLAAAKFAEMISKRMDELRSLPMGESPPLP